MSVEDTSWKAARGLMADANFIKTLQTMDCEAIPQKNINTLKGYLVEMFIIFSICYCCGIRFVLSIVNLYSNCIQLVNKSLDC